jgi:phosphopantothenoylcysteine decarboxylase/phosphopantothenate--cysteine ligase
VRGKRIVLGVAGGVAAYKAVYLARRLLEAGAEVQVVMTAGATRFVGEQTFRAITGNPVVTSLFGATTPSPHTELARWCDAIVVAPATANMMSKVAHGQSGDALAATILATDRPVLMAPAMHTEMWEQPATQRNVSILEADGRLLVGPVTGPLAGGDTGAGRMVEPDDIVAALASLFPASLAGVRVLVTAGGTREAIDPVRYIGNRSSGKMGHAIAGEAASRGAEVTLITSARRPAARGVVVVEVESAEQMAQAAWSRADQVDVAILAAAVADFRPKQAADAKIPRTGGVPEIVLEETPNVLRGLVERTAGRARIIGFAAETGSLTRAFDKAKHYGVDLLVANDVSDAESGFGTDTNRVTFISPDGSAEAMELMSKTDVASHLLDRVEALLG